MSKFRSDMREMRTFLLLWFTQLISGLGSAMTAYALVIWSYTQEGSALMTGLLMVCSYLPYVLCSIFAGALTDRWDKKKTLLVCDALAALCTLIILLLLKMHQLQIWHLYVLNAVSGLMNTVQQPASEVAVTAVLPRKHYQRVGGLRYLANSVNSICTPVITTAVMGLAGLDAVIVLDLCSFAAAFAVLLLFVRIPEQKTSGDAHEPLLQSAGQGVKWLRENRGIFHLMLFLAAINLVASMFNAALPAMLLPLPDGETYMGVVNAVTGATMLLGSAVASMTPAPKRRVRAVWWCLLLSMSTENLLLALGRTLPVWCIGAFLGWIAIPMMNANLDAVNRLTIPASMQGRVFAARNSFQFFTIPLGYFLGGWLVDCVFEPLMALQGPGSLAVYLFGSGKGSGAAMCFGMLWVLGVIACVVFRRDRYILELDRKMS